jgi:hypothetical protein
MLYATIGIPLGLVMFNSIGTYHVPSSSLSSLELIVYVTEHSAIQEKFYFNDFPEIYSCGQLQL